MCVCVCVCVAQLCPNLCDPVDHSPPGYYVHGILQARTLEWVPFAPPGESSWSGCHSLPQGNLPDPGIEPGSPALQADSLPPELLGKPLLVLREMQVKITMTYPYTPIRKGKIRNCSNTKCWWRCGETGLLMNCWCEGKMVRPLWKNIAVSLQS